MKVYSYGGMAVKTEELLTLN